MNWASFIMCTWPSEDSAVIYNNFPLFNLHSHCKKISLFCHRSWSMPSVKETRICKLQKFHVEKQHGHLIVAKYQLLVCGIRRCSGVLSCGGSYKTMRKDSDCETRFYQEYGQCGLFLIPGCC